MARATRFALVLVACAVGDADGYGYVPKPLEKAARKGEFLKATYEVKVHTSLGPRSIRVASDMSVLEALDVAGLSFATSSDCRRGNCLSCAARVQRGGEAISFVRETEAREATEPRPAGRGFREDYTSFLCDEARDDGFILACSTFVRGPGVELELEQSAAVMKLQYHERFRRGHGPDADPGSAGREGTGAG